MCGDTIKKTEPKDALSGARYEGRSHQRHASIAIKDHTLSMNPQQGAGRLPFLEYILVENPSCGSLVMSAARDVVICRWIWWV